MEWKCTSSSYRENYAYSLGIQAYIYIWISACYNGKNQTAANVN